MYLVHSFFFFYIKLFGDKMYLISDGGLSCNTLDTIESVLLTKNSNILDGIKLDVRKTIDNKYVLSRYDDLSILTCSKMIVSKSKYEYLKKVKFPSHIFKYYIPTLLEILNKYNNKKIIVIELYNNNLDGLYKILENYDYKYYFYSKDTNILNELYNKDFNKLGKILSNNDIYDVRVNNNLYKNTFLIKK